METSGAGRLDLWESGAPIDGGSAGCRWEDGTSVLLRRKDRRRGSVAMKRFQALRTSDIPSGTSFPARWGRIE